MSTAPNDSRKLPALHTSRAEFIRIRQTGGLYIDKTAHLHALLPRDNADGAYHLLTRPRRFGKTLLISTLEAWFQGQPAVVRGALDVRTGAPATQPAVAAQDLFRHLAIRQWREPQLFRPVIRLDMSAVQGDSMSALQQSLRNLLAETLTTWHQRGRDVPYAKRALNHEIRLPADTDPADCLYRLIRTLHQASQVRAVVLVDEYDAPLTPWLGQPTTVTDPLQDVMRHFYRTLKRAEPHLHYVFLTGIARFGHTNLFSALNALTDISWERRYATICGFTETEIRQDLASHLAHLREAWPGDRDVGAQLYQQYNGYRFSLQDDTPTVCNPFALTQCLQKLLDDPALCPTTPVEWPRPWAASGTPQFLVQALLRHQRPTGSAILSRTDMANWVWQPLHRLDRPDLDLLMLQTGYTTLRQTAEGFQLDFPNTEVRTDFAEGVLRESSSAYRAPLPLALCRALQEVNMEAFGCHLTTYLAGMPHAYMQVAYAYTLVVTAFCDLIHVAGGAERHHGVGRADLVVLLPDKGYVMELKYNGRLQAAALPTVRNDYGRQLVARGLALYALHLHIRHDPDRSAPPRLECAHHPLDWTPDGLSAVDTP